MNKKLNDFIGNVNKPIAVWLANGIAIHQNNEQTKRNRKETNGFADKYIPLFK